MREAESTGTGPVPSNEKDASTIKVGAAVLAVALAAWGVLWLTMRPDEPTGGRVDQGPAFALTDTEAKARFERLDSLLTQVYESRDLTLFDQIFTPDSPMLSRVRTEIRTLIRRDVLVVPSFDTQQIRVTGNSPSMVELRQVVLVRSRFVNAHGKDITVDPAPQRQTVEWQLKKIQGTWLIFDSVIVHAEPIA